MGSFKRCIRSIKLRQNITDSKGEEAVFMAKVKAPGPKPDRNPKRPALTPEARENQLIALAIDVVEERLRNGTASSQETTHFLKLGTTKARLEKEILEEQKKLITAKTKAIESQDELKEMYAEALKALRSYQGQGDSDDY
jgi:hypothetical protein